MASPAPNGVAAYPPTPTQGANVLAAGTIAAVGPGAPVAVWGPFNIMVWGSFLTTLTTTAASLNASVVSGTNVAAGQSINSVNVPRGTTWATFFGTSGTLSLPVATYIASAANGSNVLTFQGAPGPALATFVGATIINPAFATGTTVSSVGAGNTLIMSANATLDSVPIPFQFKLAAAAITVSGTDAAATFTGAAILFNAMFQVEYSFDGGQSFLPANVGGSGTIASYTTNTPLRLAFGEPERGMLYRINVLVFSAVTGVTINYRISSTGQASMSLSVPSVV